MNNTVDIAVHSWQVGGETLYRAAIERNGQEIATTETVSDQNLALGEARWICNEKGWTLSERAAKWYR